MTTIITPNTPRKIEQATRCRAGAPAPHRIAQDCAGRDGAPEIGELELVVPRGARAAAKQAVHGHAGGVGQVLRITHGAQLVLHAGMVHGLAALHEHDDDGAHEQEDPGDRRADRGDQQLVAARLDPGVCELQLGNELRRHRGGKQRDEEEREAHAPAQEDAQLRPEPGGGPRRWRLRFTGRAAQPHARLGPVGIDEDLAFGAGAPGRGLLGPEELALALELGAAGAAVAIAQLPEDHAVHRGRGLEHVQYGRARRCSAAGDPQALEQPPRGRAREQDPAAEQHEADRAHDRHAGAITRRAGQGLAARG